MTDERNLGEVVKSLQDKHAEMIVDHERLLIYMAELERTRSNLMEANEELHEKIRCLEDGQAALIHQLESIGVTPTTLTLKREKVSKEVSETSDHFFPPPRKPTLG